MGFEVFNYECQDQMNMFDLTMQQIKIDKTIRIIELFGGYGSQSMALKNIGADFEHYKLVEFDKYAVASYNAVHDTNFDVTDIRDVHGKDLEIVDTNTYFYLLTYSFPCTDLSVAGKMQGMKKGSGTRSGLLWEVERILTEIHESSGELPQLLFMENVPQVISSANINDFHAWQDFLTSLGYTSHVQTLNAKDYGVAQNRERTFMFSFLGEYNYKFPNPIPLTKTKKDYLEDEVDEKYYINSEKANKLIAQLIDNGDLQGCVGNVNPSGNGMNGNVYSGDLAPTLTTNKGEGQKIYVENDVVQIGNIMPTKTRENPNQGRVYDSNHVGTSLNCMEGGGREPMIIELGKLNSSQDGVIIDSNGIIPTLTSGHGNTPKTIVEEDMWGYKFVDTEMIRIKQATKDGYIECKIGGVADLSYPTSDTRRGRVQDNGDTCPTITAGETEICRIESRYRIRKLTPRECGRLMFVSDSDITKMLAVVSNSQAYKQFGNSIVVLVMIAMFSNLNIQSLPRWDEIKDRYM